MADQLEKGIEAFNSGDKAVAFILFREAVRENPLDSAAWYWLSRVISEPERQKECLEKALQLDPDNQEARAALQDFQPANLSDQHEPGETRPEDLPAQPPVDVPEQPSWAFPPSAPLESRSAVERLPEAEPLPVQPPEPSPDFDQLRQSRIEALAELGTNPPDETEEAQPKPKKGPSRSRRILIWIGGAAAIMLLIILGMALVTYSSLPEYDTLVPMLASVVPQSLNATPLPPTADATALAGLPPSEAETPVFNPEDWRLSPVLYEIRDLGGGQREITVELALENDSDYLGAVTIFPKGQLLSSEGQEFEVDLGFEPKMLILSGIRLRSQDAAHRLVFVQAVPAESEDFIFKIPFKVEFLDLETSLAGSGEGVFQTDIQQVLPGSPSILLAGSWEDFQADPPRGIHAVLPGEPADLREGSLSFGSLRTTPVSGSESEFTWTLDASLQNPASEASLTLRTRYPAFVTVVRDSQWGLLVPPSDSISSLTAAPGQTETDEIWSAGSQAAPVTQPETWCALGLFEMVAGDRRTHQAVVSCFPVSPPASP